MQQVHFYRTVGKSAYTESVLNIMLSSFQAKESFQKKKTTEDDHTNFTNAKNPVKNQRKYSSAVKDNIKVQNRFSPLSGFSGNW